MSTHSVAEAKNQLSQLIDRALKGEDVVITRHHQAVAELKAHPARPQAMTKADWEWIRANRMPPLPPGEDAVSIVRKMRDEDWP
jgi:antitoxin (DNA-binding transcriptional repressor) of toxin-antitoxin stability system